MSLEYTEIPVIDWTLAERDKPLFLKQLRGAMINVGLLYLSNHPVPIDLVDRVVHRTPKFFNLPQAIKIQESATCVSEAIPATGTQTHANNFGGDRVCRFEEGKPENLKLHGDALWPENDHLPRFRETMLDYYTRLEDLSWAFTSQALGLEAHELHHLFGSDRSKLQPRCKLLRYPPGPPGTTGTASGIRPHCRPHIDNSFLTYLLQRQSSLGLRSKTTPETGCLSRLFAGPLLSISGEVTLLSANFIAVRNLGPALQTTHRLAIATMHRVISPFEVRRHSIGFFSSLAMHVRIADVQFECTQFKYLSSPQMEVLDMKKARDVRTNDTTECAHFTPPCSLQLLVWIPGSQDTHRMTTTWLVSSS
ncbi:hypothetical protein DFH07DRAFT_1033389 [Mycena maculata]|uniref:Non-haem dioxygenase N-terminal domain-containing protein n=1 Tax=Mycena maculata TaxID=230809 RepID=A0AAD7K5E3_9AGAR|nr:hypothetical protein DFH07DRAFT_1033389 [Mycena maculata]